MVQKILRYNAIRDRLKAYFWAVYLYLYLIEVGSHEYMIQSGGRVRNLSHGNWVKSRVLEQGRGFLISPRAEFPTLIHSSITKVFKSFFASCCLVTPGHWIWSSRVWAMLDNCSLIGRKPGRSSGTVAQHSRITWTEDWEWGVGQCGLGGSLIVERTSYTLIGQLPGWERIWPRCTLSTTSGFFALLYNRVKDDQWHQIQPKTVLKLFSKEPNLP